MTNINIQKLPKCPKCKKGITQAFDNKIDKIFSEELGEGLVE